jgi:hypothetical protein
VLTKVDTTVSFDMMIILFQAVSATVLSVRMLPLIETRHA